MTFPEHTYEYLTERGRLLAALRSESAEHWQAYLDGIITHARYRELIAPAQRKYVAALEPHWVKAGGEPE